MEFGLLLFRFCLSRHFHEPWIMFSLHFVVDLSIASTFLIRCLVGREEAMGAMFFRGHRQTAAGSTSLRPGSLFSFNFSPPFLPSILPSFHFQMDGCTRGCP